MPRAIWTGTLSFGLVAIPVGVVTAVRSGKVAFHLLHDKDNARLERQMVCPREDRTVHPEHIVKGFEIAPDNYVVVSQEEIEGLEPVRSQSIEITGFVESGAIDSLYYDRLYHVIPEKGGEKPYRLLSKALEETRRAGIAMFVLRDREYPAAVMSVEGTLSLMTLHYFSEIVKPPGDIPESESKSREEVKTVEKIIKSMSADFDPSKYRNEEKQKVLNLIKEKAKKEGVRELPVAEEEEGEEVDLIAALEESLGKAGSSGK
jgi:DNA end-binding protein Ku